MDTRHGKLIEALNRVEQFLDKNPSAMAGVITSTAHQQFTASRTRLVEHMTAQNEHERGIRNGVLDMRALWRNIRRVVSAATSPRALGEPATPAEPAAPPVSEAATAA